jgi:pimeloyl-ACP methyl ester carboxylesterase/glycine cleavage system regulatory protein
LPGFGGTADLPPSERTIPGYARWVNDFLVEAKVDAPAIVIGHSFGGGVAICLAHRFPESVAQLVLVNSVGGAVWGAGSQPRGLDERPLWEWGLSLTRELVPPNGFRVVASVREDFLPNLIRNPRALWDVGTLARRADLRDELAELRTRGVPVVVVSAAADGVVPMSAFEALCGALGAEGQVMPGNHTWLLTDPDAFDTVMANVLENQHEVEAPVSELRGLMVPTTVPRKLADELVATAPSLWLSSDAALDLAGDLALCHPPLGPTEVRARITRSKHGTWRLTVAAHDRPGLLADTAGILTREGLSIRTASLATWSHLDLCLHALTLDDPVPGPDKLDRIGRKLRSAGAGEWIEVDYQPVGRASVRNEGDANGDPMISVGAPDQPGLLWAVCRLLADQGVNIQAAWVSGDDDTVNDVFVVRGFPDLPQLQRRLSREERPLHERIGGMLVGSARSLVRR